jgi:hypothetical protein
MMKKTMMLAACVLVFSWASCGSGNNHKFDGTSDTIPDADGTDTLEPCSPSGETRCFLSVYQLCQGGGWVDQQDCSENDLQCDDELGCVVCVPRMTYCDGELLMQCNDDGTGGIQIADCMELEGSTCDPGTGSCVALCQEAAVNRSNVGCEYWAVDLDNAENSVDTAAAEQFAVAVANVHNRYTSSVRVTINEGGYGNPIAASDVELADIPPGGIHVFNLPRRDVDGPNPTANKDEGPQSCVSSLAFKIESTIPVVAYQFNPIVQAFSNDASLLIPKSGIDGLYYVVTPSPANPMPLPGFPEPNRSYVTVVGTEENTLVRFTPTYDIEASIGTIPAGFAAIPDILAGEVYEVTLGPYDVANFETRAMAGLMDAIPDLTGSVVDADKPVAVFSGVDLTTFCQETPPGCATPGDCCCCAEHCEQQVIPKTAMGKKFVVTRSPVRSTDGWIEADYYRVLAARDDTVVTTNLADPATFTLNELEYMDFPSKTGFVLESTKPVHVIQYMASQQQCSPLYIGDPSMVPVPAVEERRSYYVVTTGVGFMVNYVVVSMPEGYDALLDGGDVASSCGAPVTTGVLDGETYLQYTCEVADGAHTIDGGSQPVGVIVYGNYRAGSYAYPGGSDLRKIFLE